MRLLLCVCLAMSLMCLVNSFRPISRLFPSSSTKIFVTRDLRPQSPAYFEDSEGHRRERSKDLMDAIANLDPDNHNKFNSNADLSAKEQIQSARIIEMVAEMEEAEKRRDTAMKSFEIPPGGLDQFSTNDGEGISASPFLYGPADSIFHTITIPVPTSLGRLTFGTIQSPLTNVCVKHSVQLIDPSGRYDNVLTFEVQEAEETVAEETEEAEHTGGKDDRDHDHDHDHESRFEHNLKEAHKAVDDDLGNRNRENREKVGKGKVVDRKWKTLGGMVVTKGVWVQGTDPRRLHVSFFGTEVVPCPLGVANNPSAESRAYDIFAYLDSLQLVMAGRVGGTSFPHDQPHVRNQEAHARHQIAVDALRTALGVSPSGNSPGGTGPDIATTDKDHSLESQLVAGVGHSDVAFLDERLRIMRGSAGGLYVMKRSRDVF